MSENYREKGESVHDLTWPLLGKDSFRFYEDEYEHEIFSMLSRACAPTSVILAGNRDSHSHSLHDFRLECRSGGNKLSNVRIFIILHLATK